MAGWCCEAGGHLVKHYWHCSGLGFVQEGNTTSSKQVAAYQLRNTGCALQVQGEVALNTTLVQYQSNAFHTAAWLLEKRKQGKWAL